jgi:hypothetical protein
MSLPPTTLYAQSLSMPDDGAQEPIRPAQISHVGVFELDGSVSTIPFVVSSVRAGWPYWTVGTGMIEVVYVPRGMIEQ